MIPRSAPLRRKKPFRPKRRKPRPGRLQGADMTELRELVWERDGPDCVRCGQRMVKYPAHPLQENGYHLAHKIPRSRGGKDTPENTEAVCMHCHLIVEHWGGKPKGGFDVTS